MEVVFLLEYVVGWSRDAMLKPTPDTPSRRAVENVSSNKVIAHMYYPADVCVTSYRHNYEGVNVIIL